MKTFLLASALVSILALVRPSSAGGGAPAGAEGRSSTGVCRSADAVSGFLDVASDPPARIAIDGTETGKTTPQLHLALAPGHHKLTLVTLDGARQRVIGFAVEAGQTTKLTVHLAS